MRHYESNCQKIVNNKVVAEWLVQRHLDRVAFIRKRLSEVMEGTADASIFEAKLKKFWWTQRQKTKEARQDE